jgi:succinoglycan biosynthesis protein ExoA
MSQEEDVPLISVIVCTLNEERWIGALIQSVLVQRRVQGSVEIIVADGGSVDGTCDIVRRYADRSVRLLHNELRRAVFGFNLAARAARGRYLAFLGGHARYDPEYLAKCLDLLRRTGAGNVGGVIEHAGEGATGRAIALAMSTFLGVGGPKFRSAKRETVCESVMGGFLERSLFESLGGFNETNIVNQDGEFNARLRQAGYTVVVSPDIRSTYFVRPSLLALEKQYFSYGYYRRWTEVQHPGSVPWRVYIPPTFVAGAVVCGALAVFSHSAAPLSPLAAYAVLLMGSVAFGLRRGDPAAAIRIPAAIAVMHASFGVGWLTGFVRHRRPRYERASTSS